MTPERWQLVEDLFDAAKDLSPTAIDSWLHAQCGDDHELEREVASLVQHHRQARTGLLGEGRKPWEEVLRDTALSAVEPTLFCSGMARGTEHQPLTATVHAEEPPGAGSSYPPRLAAGMKVGPYRILRVLGEGGMGIVYHAQDERLNRAVALKTLRGSAVDEKSERRLLREGRIAASMSHPGICRLYDIGDCQGRLYLVMELLEGEPLSNAIARGSMEVSKAIEIILGVLDALEALHEKALVHRDLKPSNIFLTPHGVKLLDFGLSRTAVRGAAPGAGVETETQLAPMAGTPFYISPEQLEGREPDSRSDLYAAGVILTEMLASRRELAATFLEMLCRRMDETAPATGVIPGWPVEAIIHRALLRNPESRYQSARSMAEDLRSVRPGMPAAQIPSSRAKRLIALPFRMLRADPDFDFLSFSLPDAITNSLSALSSLVVRSSAAASRYTGPSLDLKTIAVEAEVDFALTGTLLRNGDQLRVATQLAEARTGTVIWAQTSQLGIQDIFQFQDELVKHVVESLALPLTGHDSWLLARDVPASPLAYEYYLRANQLIADWRHQRTARDLYLKCLDIDSRYAPAWARLGRCHRAIAKNGGDPEDFERADAAFRRSLQLNPELNLAHSLYSYLEVDSARAPQAMIRLLHRAAGNPNDPDLYAGLVYACRFCGLLDASMAAHRRARSLDPLIATSVTSTWFMAGDYLAVHENSAGDSIVDAHALIALGRETEALDLLQKNEKTFGELLAGDLNPQYQFRYWNAVSLRAMLQGKCEESLVALERTMNWRRGEELFHAAGILARLGEVEKAIDELERAAGYGFLCFPAVSRSHQLNPLRESPRFTTLLSQLERSCEEARRIFITARGCEILL